MSPPSQPWSDLPLPDARRIVEDQARALNPGAAELVALADASGRVLAEDLLADRDFPPFPRATRDGYAVVAADVAAAPVRLRVIGEVRAGSPMGELVVGPGQAAEIMTGAPVPQGADAVVMIEYTRRDKSSVQIERVVAARENVVPTGSEGRKGQLLLPAGTRMRYAQIAMAAALGKAQIWAYPRPRTAILSTGDEIVDITARPAPHQIRNSNMYSLATQVRAAGGEPVTLPIAADDPAALRRLMEQGLAADLLLITGGVSMGKYDLVERVLAELRAEFFFTGALIQPGRPVVCGRVPRQGTSTFTYFFGLPGNPISTMVTFEIFVRPAIDALTGATPTPLRFLQARLKGEVRIKTGLTRFLPAVLSGAYDQVQVELLKWQGSGDIAAAARANCYLVVPPDRDWMAAGEMVAVLPYSC